MHEMNLSIVEGEIKIGLLREGSWQDVSVEVGSIVVVSLVIANSRHKGGVGCKFLGQLSEQVPDWSTLATTLAVYSSICDISSKKDHTKRSYNVIRCDFVNNKCSKGCKSSHISEDCDVHLIHCLIFQGWRGEVFYFGEGSCLTVSNPIVITLQRIQIFHCCYIDSSLETSDFAYIICMKSSISYVFEQARNAAIFHYGLNVMLRVGDPNHLHFCLIPCQPQMYLFMPRVMSDLYSGNTNELRKRDELIAIGIKEIEYWLAIYSVYAVFWLHEIEVSDEVIDACDSILVRVIRGLPKAFEAIITYFCISKHTQKQYYEDHQGCFHQLFIANQRQQSSIKVNFSKDFFQASHQQKTRRILIVDLIQHIFHLAQPNILFYIFLFGFDQKQQIYFVKNYNIKDVIT